jgi:hypothetical protein
MVMARMRSQGTFASAGLDVPAGIRKLGAFIRFVHFRDVVGEVPSFRESWQVPLQWARLC